MTTIYEYNEKLFLPHKNSNQQYYALWHFENGSIVMKKHLHMTSYTTSDEYEPRPFDAAHPEGSTIFDCLSYTAFWRYWRDKFTKLMIKSKAMGACDICYIFHNYYKSLKK